MPDRNAHRLLFSALTVAAVLLAFPAPRGWADSSWMAPPEANGYSNPNAANAASVEAGKEVYLKYCVLCHGEKGLGNGPSSQALEPKPANFTIKARMQKQSDGALAWKIVTGRGPMPSWEPVLSEDEIWNVINYVRTFSK